MHQSPSSILLAAMLTDRHTMAAVDRNLLKIGHKIGNKAEEKKRG
jgi:hypothetical protein